MIALVVLSLIVSSLTLIVVSTLTLILIFTGRRNMATVQELLGLTVRANDAEIVIREKLANSISPAALDQVRDGLAVVVTNLEQDAGTTPPPPAPATAKK